MKNFKYILFSVLVISVLIPQLAFASWWNPFSWKIFNRSPDIKVEKTTTPSGPIYIYTQTTNEEPKQESFSFISELEKNRKNSVSKEAPANSILCNGTYWTSCPAGQNFFCPTTGDAQCLINDNSSNTRGSFSQDYYDRQRLNLELFKTQLQINKTNSDIELQRELRNSSTNCISSISGDAVYTHCD